MENKERNDKDRIRLIESIGIEGQANQVSDSNSKSSQKQWLQPWYVPVQSNQYGFGVAQTEEFENSNNDGPVSVLSFIASTDNEGDQGQKSKNCKSEKCHYPTPKWWTIVHDKTKFLQHHNVDKSLIVGRIQIWDSVRLFLSVPFLHVNLSDFVLLILQSVLNLPKLPFLLALYKLLFGFGRQVISEAHSQSIANQNWNSNCKNVARISSCSETSQNDGQCIDDTIQTSIHGRFQVLTSFNVFFFVRCKCFVDSVGAEERLFLGACLHWFYDDFCSRFIKYKKSILISFIKS